MAKRKTRKKNAFVTFRLDQDAYLDRLRLMREMIAGSQVEFAKRMNIPVKRWANYEYGYPISRSMAWLLWHHFHISVEWLWYGEPGNMDPDFLKRIAAAEQVQRESRVARQELKKATARVRKADAERKRILHSK